MKTESIVISCLCAALAAALESQLYDKQINAKLTLTKA